MASDIGALRAALDVFVAALDDNEFDELIARTRAPKTETPLDADNALARGREAFKAGGHNRLTTLDVEREPATDHIIER